MTIEEIYQLFLETPKVSTDTRKDVKNTIFFALSGENFDGNQYAVQALDLGAKYAVVDKLVSDDPRLIHVDSVLETLQLISNRRRQDFNFPVLALTGSNGKTTTKELIVSVLSEAMNVASTQGNYNNHIGVPLTLLSTPLDSDILILEMGANHLGEIKELCDIADPDLGTITNIGKAHLEGFLTIENIKITKGALFRHVISKGGNIFYNEDDSMLCDIAQSYTLSNTFSLSNAKIVSSFPFMVFDYKEKLFETNISGDYNLPNLITAIEIGRFYRLDDSIIYDGLLKYNPTNNRSQLIEIGSNIMILDAYNANPVSMSKSLNNFMQIKTEKSKLIVLGDMLELGDIENQEHEEILGQIESGRCKKVFLVGDIFKRFEDKYNHYDFYENIDALRDSVDLSKFDDHLIFVKGSRGIGLEELKLSFN